MSIDHTAAGLQHVLTGAERASDAALAQRRADAPLRPAKPQARCDHGLFSEDARQGDLVDLARGRGGQ
jgi:hypothetical protein